MQLTVSKSTDHTDSPTPRGKGGRQWENDRHVYGQPGYTGMMTTEICHAVLCQVRDCNVDNADNIVQCRRTSQVNLEINQIGSACLDPIVSSVLQEAHLAPDDK